MGLFLQDQVQAVTSNFSLLLAVDSSPLWLDDTFGMFCSSYTILSVETGSRASSSISSLLLLGSCCCFAKACISFKAWGAKNLEDHLGSAPLLVGKITGSSHGGGKGTFVCVCVFFKSTYLRSTTYLNPENVDIRTKWTVQIQIFETIENTVSWKNGLPAYFQTKLSCKDNERPPEENMTRQLENTLWLGDKTFLKRRWLPPPAEVG